MSKVLQHKYFHEEIVESMQIFGKQKKKKGKMGKKAPSHDISETDPYMNSFSKGNRGRLGSKSSKLGKKKSRSLSRRRMK